MTKKINIRHVGNVVSQVLDENDSLADDPFGDLKKVLKECL